MNKYSTKFFIFFFSLIAFLGYLQFNSGAQRNLIDYDDLDVVAKMLKFDLHSYFTDWLPDRRNYAFPLRDLSIFFDQWISTKEYPSFWISNFFYFTLSLIFIALTIQVHFPNSMKLAMALIATCVLHPLNTEVIEWITCRKYLVGFVPIAIGTFLVSRWKLTPLNKNRLIILAILWLCSLLSYPTAVFWIFWAIFYIKRGNLFKEYSYKLLTLAIISMLYLYLVGHNTGEINSSLVNILPAYKKSFHFGVNALGRGYFNLFSPFWTFPYYKEGHLFTFLGYALIILTVTLWRFVAVKPLKVKNQEQHLKISQLLNESMIWLLGGGVFLIPTTNTILGFFDFMLADRHFFYSIPYFVISGGYFFEALRLKLQGPTKKLPVPLGLPLRAIFGVFLLSYWGGSIYTIHKKAPLWHDDFKLMENCALNEKSYRCYSQAIRRRFFKSDCNRVKDLILEAAEAYAENPPFALEFNSEVPFYHASCIALNESLDPKFKVKAIEALEDTYRSSPEIIFPLVLANLELGNKAQAFELANSYYLSDLSSGPISSTRSLQSIYAGHISALCAFDSTSLCKSRLKNFLTYHSEAKVNSGFGQWGFNATNLMAKRGGISSP